MTCNIKNTHSLLKPVTMVKLYLQSNSDIKVLEKCSRYFLILLKMYLLEIESLLVGVANVIIYGLLSFIYYGLWMPSR